MASFVSDHTVRAGAAGLELQLHPHVTYLLLRSRTPQGSVTLRLRTNISTRREGGPPLFIFLTSRWLELCLLENTLLLSCKDEMKHHHSGHLNSHEQVSTEQFVFRQSCEVTQWPCYPQVCIASVEDRPVQNTGEPGGENRSRGTVTQQTNMEDISEICTHAFVVTNCLKRYSCVF